MAREVQAPVPTKGIAKQLPGKAQTSEAIPIQTVSEGTKVVAVGSEETDGLEKEAADADQVEIIDMPVE
ncbi:hypothetical protein [Bdellovibrio bacteriovorus]|uniref:hypothetical protein n=1 Tax=Bdellovibrio bacteriovorus TaxID=959 RepID=UPI0035A5C09E